MLSDAHQNGIRGGAKSGKSVNRFLSDDQKNVRKCGVSLVMIQTTEAVVPSSNPASLTLENYEDRQSHCVYCKISGQRGKPPPEAKTKKHPVGGSLFRLKAATYMINIFFLFVTLSLEGSSLLYGKSKNTLLLSAKDL